MAVIQSVCNYKGNYENLCTKNYHGSIRSDKATRFGPKNPNILVGRIKSDSSYMLLRRSSALQSLYEI